MSERDFVVRLRDYEKVVVLGIGNELRKDDAVGVFIVNSIARTDRIVPMVVRERVEDYIESVIEEKPSLLVAFDCVDFRGKGGDVVCFRPEEPEVRISFTTHRLPILPLLVFVGKEVGRCEVLVVGVQPVDVSYGIGISDPVMQSAEDILKDFEEGFIRCRSLF